MYSTASGSAGAPNQSGPSTHRSRFSSSKATTPARAGSSFIRPQSGLGIKAKKLGDGIPGFRTSFDVAGKGGGAFRPISENFSVNPANGTLSLALPLPTSPSRSGFGPSLSLAYDSGAGNGPFGFGWNVSLPSISRKIAHGVPHYVDGEDDLALSGADIVPQLESDGTIRVRLEKRADGDFKVSRYLPRIDSGSLQIERWSRVSDAGDVHWKTISAENVVSIFGDSDHSRLQDFSADRKRIFSWLLSRSYDAYGNAIEYLYKNEDNKGLTDEQATLPVWEQNRSEIVRGRQRYVKHIKYGNRTPCRDLETWEVSSSSWPVDADWLFEVVFDYGDHDKEAPGTVESSDWAPRQDAFSYNQAGFEVRTYRLCRRILMFHHVPEQTTRPEDLVALVSLKYEESPQRSLLTDFVVTGYSMTDDALQYKTSSLPPWSFGYTNAPDVREMEALDVKVTNLINVPGSSGSSAEWIDLDSEGIPGLLTRLKDSTMIYQRNNGYALQESDHQFGMPLVLNQQPSLSHDGAENLVDLSRSGHLSLVCRNASGDLRGYYEREDSDSWSNYSEFPETPTGDAVSDIAISIDLTGDGLTDVIRATNDSQQLIWQQSLGKDGLSGQHRTFSSSFGRPPRLAQTSESRTYVADMTGDGLSDLVEISASAITYWPSCGHGSFGAAVEMGNPPLLSEHGIFDHARVRLVDVDGTGTADLLYILPDGGAILTYNLAGNSWSSQIFISTLPRVAPSSVFVLDILGQGTACLCWTDTWNSSDTTEIKYIELIASTKPNLLREYSGGFGTTTSVIYKPSTKFYCEDKAQGQPWSTKLPFPVQCVSKVQLEDRITGRVMTTEYAYHNGCYDSVEMQFAGFEMVEQFQHERLMLGEGELYESPIAHTKSWFNVGQSLGVDERHFLTPSVVSSSCLDDTPGVLIALKGAKIRSEIYSRDGTERAHLPFEIEEHSYDVKQLQPRSSSAKHAVVRMTPRASVVTQYERQMQDSRITHEIVLKTNDFGDVEDSIRVVYPRESQFASSLQFEDVKSNQKAGNVSFTRSWFTNSINEPLDFHNFRKPVAWRQQEHEVLGFSFPPKGLLDVDQIRVYNFRGLTESKDQSTTFKALRSDVKTLFQNSALTKPLSEGVLEKYSVSSQSFTLAFTPDVLSRVETSLLNYGVFAKPMDEIRSDGGYIEFDADGHWWVPSPVTSYRNLQVEQSASEIQSARKSFYTPTTFTDAFGNSTFIDIDNYFLLALRVKDAAGNITSFENSYERLQPIKITDKNQNIQQVILDPLGRVIASAMLGKGDRDRDNDSLEGFKLDVTDEELGNLLTSSAEQTAVRLLGNADKRYIHCLNQFVKWGSKQDSQALTSNGSAPVLATASSASAAFVVEISRDSAFQRSATPNIRIEINYLNGSGKPLQLAQLNDPSTLEQSWLITGNLITDSREHLVRSYLPFFASNPTLVPAVHIIADAETNFYDVTGRAVGGLTANHTWTKTVFTPWLTTEYNVGDTVLISDPQADPDIGMYIKKVKSNRYLPTWHQMLGKGGLQEQQAAAKSKTYADSPIGTHQGSCGLPVRQVRQIRLNDDYQTYTAASAYDYSGNKIRDFDSLNRLVEKKLYNLINRPVFTSNMDSGDVWTLENVQGNRLLSWNSRGICFQYRYDVLQRETEKLMYKKSETAKLLVRKTYGEICPNAEKINLKGQVWQIRDQSGFHVNEKFDIRGHCTERTFQPAREYKAVIDWKVDEVLEKSIFSYMTFYDNYGQITLEQDPRGNRTRRTFTRTGRIIKVDHRTGGDDDDDQSQWSTFLSSATFSSDNLPVEMVYGNGVKTTFSYDDKTRYLISQRTTNSRLAGASRSVTVLEDISHSYDVIGQRIYTYDSSEQSKFFRNCLIKPEWTWTYDTLGQLIRATGRSQLPSSGSGRGAQLEPYNATTGTTPARGVTNGDQLYEYVETFSYDLAGNILSMKHEALKDTSISGWKRLYSYEESSCIDSSTPVLSNRLSKTSVGSKEELYHYDEDGGQTGCMTSMPGYSRLTWNADNMMSSSSTQIVSAGIPETTYYVYDHTGKRTRKVTEGSSTGQTSANLPQKRKDTLYLSGGLELQHTISGNSKDRSLRHIATVSGEKVLALIDTTTDVGSVASTIPDSDDSDDEDEDEDAPLIRYQVGTNMELDDSGYLISYEEYSSFGATTYASCRTDVNAPSKYRYASYERDVETGLMFCSSRYYIPWLGRWTSCDSLGIQDGLNVYQYCGNSPISFTDPTGQSGVPEVKGFNYRVWDGYQKIKASYNKVMDPDYAWKSYQTRVNERLADKIGTPVKNEAGQEVYSTKQLAELESFAQNRELQMPQNLSATRNAVDFVKDYGPLAVKGALGMYAARRGPQVVIKYANMLRTQVSNHKEMANIVEALAHGQTKKFNFMSYDPEMSTVPKAVEFQVPLYTKPSDMTYKASNKIIDYVEGRANDALKDLDVTKPYTDIWNNNPLQSLDEAIQGGVAGVRQFRSATTNAQRLEGAYEVGTNVAKGVEAVNTVNDIFTKINQ